LGGGNGTLARPPGTGGRKLLPPLADGELGGSPGDSDRLGGGGALLKGPPDALGLEPLGAGAFEGESGALDGSGA
jgi:hypothetical protein